MLHWRDKLHHHADTAGCQLFWHDDLLKWLAKGIPFETSEGGMRVVQAALQEFMGKLQLSCGARMKGRAVVLFPSDDKLPETVVLSHAPVLRAGAGRALNFLRPGVH